MNKKVFGPSPIQDYNVYSPCINNKPSGESLDITVCLSSILPWYYCRHCPPFQRWPRETWPCRPHGITM